MCDTEANNLYRLTIILSTYQPKRKEKSIMVHKLKMSFPEKKLPLIENLKLNLYIVLTAISSSFLPFCVVEVSCTSN